MASSSYGNWSNVTIPSSSNYDYSKAGSVFGQALTNLGKVFDNYQTKSDAALKRAKTNNLATYTAGVDAAAAEGLAQYNQAKEINPAMQGLIDPLQAQQAAANLRAKALQASTDAFTSGQYQDRTDVLANNLNALQQAYAANPSVAPYLQIGEAGNILENSEAILKGGDTAKTAVNAFAKAAEKYGYKFADLAAQETEAQRSALLKEGFKLDEANSAIDAYKSLEAKRSDLASIDPTAAAALDQQITRIGQARDLELQGLQDQYADLKGLRGNDLQALKGYMNYKDQTLAGFINKEMSKETWWPGKEGGESLKQDLMAEMKAGGRLAALTEPQVIAALDLARETDNWIFSEGANVDEVVSIALEMAKNPTIADATRLESRANAYKAYSQDVISKTAQYDSAISQARSQAYKAAGIRNYRNNSDYLKAALARAKANGTVSTPAEERQFKEEVEKNTGTKPDLKTGSESKPVNTEAGTAAASPLQDALARISTPPKQSSVDGLTYAQQLQRAAAFTQANKLAEAEQRLGTPFQNLKQQVTPNTAITPANILADRAAKVAQDVAITKEINNAKALINAGNPELRTIFELLMKTGRMTQDEAAVQAVKQFQSQQ